MIEDLIVTYADRGFGYAVAIFLLVTAYYQDRAYLAEMTKISMTLTMLSEDVKAMRQKI